MAFLQKLFKLAHAVPAVLLGEGFKLPKAASVHGWQANPGVRYIAGSPMLSKTAFTLALALVLCTFSSRQDGTN
jgi:hypothetical protein